MDEQAPAAQGVCGIHGGAEVGVLRKLIRDQDGVEGWWEVAAGGVVKDHKS